MAAWQAKDRADSHSATPLRKCERELDGKTQCFRGFALDITVRFGAIEAVDDGTLRYSQAMWESGVSIESEERIPIPFCSITLTVLKASSRKDSIEYEVGDEDEILDKTRRLP